MSFSKRERGEKSRKKAIVDECQHRRVRMDAGEGLHLRAAAALSSVASAYACKVSVNFEHRQADAKSIIELLCLAASGGSELVLEAVGPGSVQALNRIEHLIRHGFQLNA